jgi:hypothetical protein
MEWDEQQSVLLFFYEILSKLNLIDIDGYVKHDSLILSVTDSSETKSF